ncbi:kinase-like domain-containing protein, partial [Cyathus striatus]
ICSNKYELSHLLGVGGFGATYTALNKKTCNRYVVKVQKKGTYSTSEQNKIIRNEIKILNKVKGHRNVVSFYGTYDDSSYNYLVFEYCDGITLQDAIECDFICKDDYLTKKVFRQILNGVEHIHSKGIFHCDLKPDNIIYSSKMKIIDFGLSTNKPTRSGMVGTYPYMAPEIFQSSEEWDCEKADVWSLGMILMMIVSNAMPWLQATYDDEGY